MREKARRLVKVLDAVAAPGSGATDPERETARRMAQKIRDENPHLDQPGTVFVVGGVEFDIGGGV